MKKPLIVITPQRIPSGQCYGGEYNCSNVYNTDAVLESGGLPLIPPFLSAEDALELMEQADGLFMSGGADVDPARYGEHKHEKCGVLQPLRDESDLNLLKAALQLHRPVLCICRGCQIANVHFGGTLYQDIAAQYGTAIEHDVLTIPELHGECHRVEIVPGTPLAKLFGEKMLGVNTLHHQAVKELGPQLRPMAYAPDGICESWYLPDETQWLRAYQWHPEMMYDASQRRTVFGEFLKACGAK